MDEIALNDALRSFEILAQAVKDLEKNMDLLKKQCDYGFDIEMRIKTGFNIIDILGAE